MTRSPHFNVRFGVFGTTSTTHTACVGSVRVVRTSVSAPNAFTLSVAIAGIMETGPPPPSILECLGLPDAELPDPELGQAESAAEDEDEDEDEDDEVVEAFFLLDFPDSQMEMEWRRRGRPWPGQETCGDGPHTRSFRTARGG